TRGWGDIGYSYLVDKYGNVWTGRQGGDNTEGGHAYGWNKGSIGIAAIGTYSVTPPTPAMVASIANLIAEKFTQVGVQPHGLEPRQDDHPGRDARLVQGDAGRNHRYRARRRGDDPERHRPGRGRRRERPVHRPRDRQLHRSLGSADGRHLVEPDLRDAGA